MRAHYGLRFLIYNCVDLYARHAPSLTSPYPWRKQGRTGGGDKAEGGGKESKGNARNGWNACNGRNVRNAFIQFRKVADCMPFLSNFAYGFFCICPAFIFPCSSIRVWYDIVGTFDTSIYCGTIYT